MFCTTRKRLFRVLYEWLNRVFSKIWTQCDAMRTEILKRGFGIRFRSGCNVAALGIQDDGDHRAKPMRFFVDRVNDMFERGPAFGAEDFEEGRVGFECRSVARSLFNEIQAEVPCGSGSGFVQIRNMRVQSNTE